MVEASPSSCQDRINPKLQSAAAPAAHDSVAARVRAGAPDDAGEARARAVALSEQRRALRRLHGGVHRRRGG